MSEPQTELLFGAAAAAERGAILEHLDTYNGLRGAPANAQPICIAIRGDQQSIAGGLYGMMLYDWLAIELLFVPEHLRGTGLGSRLMGEAEQQAKSSGCIGAWLDTFSFQARGFYEKLGYSLAGTIADHPIGGARYFLTRRWG
ncbi:MAG TPA: GNAT family N-acetyltransferase [Sphingomicrobium sp.]